LKRASFIHLKHNTFSLFQKSFVLIGLLIYIVDNSSYGHKGGGMKGRGVREMLLDLERELLGE